MTPDAARRIRSVSTLYEAVGLPLRVRILVDIAEHEPTSPKEIAGRLRPVSLGTVAYHVRWLSEREWIVSTATVMRRGAVETFWRVPDTLAQREVLLDLAKARLA
jgi:hypothetical protein